MSSGTFETLFFQKAVPLMNDVTGYSTLTMFAIGNQGYLEGQSFYAYQSTCGFQDSSTLTTILNEDFNSTLSSQISSLKVNAASTISQLNSNIAFIGKTYISTIPLMRWISSQTVTNYPFYYNSTFIISSLNSYSSIVYSDTSNVYNNLNTFFTSSYVTSNLNSTFLFDFITSSSNTKISTIITSTFISSFISTFVFSTFNTTLISSVVNIEYLSTLFSSFVSTGVAAPSYSFDFASTGIVEYSSSINTPSLWLGSNLSKLINSGNYTTYVNLQYSLSLSTNTTSFSWVSTLGVFNQLDDPSYTYGNKGVSFTTRLGNDQYSHINTTLVFNPKYSTHIPINISNFHLDLYVNSNNTAVAPAYDLFIPGENNVTFTLVPLARS